MTEPSTGGLIYMRARWMDPLTGRFISEDPARHGANWYIYWADNPVTLADGSGREFSLADSLIAGSISATLNGLINGFNVENIVSGFLTGFLTAGVAGLAYGNLPTWATAAMENAASWRAAGAGSAANSLLNIITCYIGGNRDSASLVAAGLFGAMGGATSGIPASGGISEGLQYWVAQITLGLMIADAEAYGNAF